MGGVEDPGSGMRRWWGWTRRRVAIFDKDVIDGFLTNPLLVLTHTCNRAVGICVFAVEGGGQGGRWSGVRDEETVAVDAPACGTL